MLKFGLFLVGGILLAACSTSVTYHQPLPSEMSGDIHVAKIEVTPGTIAPSTVGERLKSAVERELIKRKSGATPVMLTLQVTEFRVQDQGARFFAGAFAGSNILNVSVEVRDASDQLRSKFDVARSSNPGGYGAFYDQEAATIQAAAEGVVNALFGEQSSGKR